MGKVIPFPKGADANSEALPEADLSSDVKAPAPSPEELGEMLEIFKQARRGLTEDGAAAVLALRQHIGIHQALVNLLLDGQIDAEVIDRNEKLTTRNLRFWALPSDEKTAKADKLDEPSV